MSSNISNQVYLNTLNTDKCSSSFNKAVNYIYKRADILDTEKYIPNIFCTPEFNQSDDVLCSLSVLETEKDIPNIFNVITQADSTHISSYIEKSCEYPNLFTLPHSYSEQCGFKSHVLENYNNYANVFSLTDIQHNDCAQTLEIYNSIIPKQVQNNYVQNDKLLNKTLSEDIYTAINDLEVNDSNSTDKYSIVEEKISSALCYWYIFTGTNVRDYNIKTYFPQREINSICIMKDIKLMLINMGTTYFLEDKKTHMYVRNGNISITGLTPEMFESVTISILECSNLYKILCCTITKWKKKCDDSIVKALIFAVSNIMDDYERTIHAISNESLLSLVERLSHIIPRLQLLAYICDLKISSYNVNSDDDIPCGVKLLNKIHGCLFEFRFPHYLFLKMLLYMFESCCLAYFKMLSNWTLKGILNGKESAMFIKLKPDIEVEDSSSQKHLDRFIIAENVEVPIFLDKYKKDILYFGKTMHFFSMFNDLNVFLPDFTCCFDAVDTQRVYEQFSAYFKHDSSLKTSNCVKRMPNCYLFESIIESLRQKDCTDKNNIAIDNITNNVQMSSNSDSSNFFQIPDWTCVNNTYDFNKPHGFFMDNSEPLIYNGKTVNVINMIDYVPHSILIPARIQKNVCDKQILDMYFVQENLMGRLYYLSQCFFLMNWQFSSKLCDLLFDGIINNRQKPYNIFNQIKLKSIVDEAIQDGFSLNEQHNLTLEMTFIPYLNGVIEISDVEFVELNYSPEWPMNMILSNKILLKYRRIFTFASRLEYVSWSLFKAGELLSVYKNDTGLEIRKINIIKYWMIQFVSSIQQYYKQIVVSSCWSELNEDFENAKNYDDIYGIHKQYMHKMLKRCMMVVGLKDKLCLLNKLYKEILAFYQTLASGQFYLKNSEWVHSDFVSMELTFSRFVKLREMFYTSVLQTVQANEKDYVEQLESLIIILGPSPSYNFE